jgi:O-antigen ligase
VLPALYGVVELISGAKHQGRLLGPFPHPNIFGFYLVISIAASLYLAKTRTFAVSQSLRLGLLLYILVLVVLLLFTKTRAAWAACAAIFLVFGIFSERRYLVYLLATSALALLIPEVRERILDAFDPTSYWTSQYNSYEWRKDLWRSAWNWMSLGSMPFGYGLASFQHYSPQFLTSHLWPTNGVIEYGAHSLYVQWFFETGVVGVLAAAWLYFRLLRILAAGLKEDRLQTIIILALVCGYLVASYSDNMLSYLPVNWCFWFLLGSACAVLLRRNNQAGAAALESGKPTSARSVRSALYAHSGLSSERPEVLK